MRLSCLYQYSTACCEGSAGDRIWAVCTEGAVVVYACVQDVSVSWEQYQRVAAPLVEPAAAGLILHVAGPTDEGVRIIGVWQSAEAWERYRADRLLPAIAALGGPARPEPSFRELRPEHVVLGESKEVVG